MSAPKLTFPGVTIEQYARLRAAEAQAGISIVGQSGSAQAHGCTIAYDWPGHPGCESAPLTLTLEHAPMFCGGLALHKLHDLIEGVRANTGENQ